MAIDHIQFTLGGRLSPGQLSSAQMTSYRRVAKRVELSLVGGAPADSLLTVRLRLNGVEQPALYSLPPGLCYAENAASLEVLSNVGVDVVVVSDGGAADLDVRVEFESAPNLLGLNTTDLGLGTLGQLKRFLMNAAEVESSTYDAAIAVIGKGVSKMFDYRTGRVLRRAEDAVETCPAYRSGYRAKHFPIESISRFEAKYNEVYGWADVVVTSAVENIEYENGILRMYEAVMRDAGQFRITLTGGYWVDISDDDSGTLPEGATALPDDLKMAWYLQCQHIWLNRDNLGIAYAPSGEVKSKPISMEKVTLLPLVGMTLANYSYPAVIR